MTFAVGVVKGHTPAAPSLGVEPLGALPMPSEMASTPVVHRVSAHRDLFPSVAVRRYTFWSGVEVPTLVDLRPKSNITGSKSGSVLLYLLTRVSVPCLESTRAS